MPTDKFSTEEANLLAQSLSELEEGLLYVEMSLLHPDEKEIIGLIEGIQTLPWFNEAFKKFCKDLIPFFNAYGIGKLDLSELTSLGLKVGHKNKSETTAEKEDEE